MSVNFDEDRPRKSRYEEAWASADSARWLRPAMMFASFVVGNDLAHEDDGRGTEKIEDLWAEFQRLFAEPRHVRNS